MYWCLAAVLLAMNRPVFALRTPGPSTAGSQASGRGGNANANGAKIFAANCVECHGADGAGRMLGQPDFRNPAWQRNVSDEDLFKVIKWGKEPMPFWVGALSDRQISAVVAFIRRLGRDDSDRVERNANGKTAGQAPGVTAPGQAKPPSEAQSGVTPGQPAPAKGPAGAVLAWTCPMHPDLRFDAPGKCPKCGMTLVPANPTISGKYDLEVDSIPAAVRPGLETTLRFRFFEPERGRPASRFSPTHTKLFHLFIVSQDMNYFAHIHPVLEPDGSFQVKTQFPSPGAYKLYCDVYPSDGTPQVLQDTIVTAGYVPDLFLKQARLVPDKTLTRDAGGVHVALTLEPASIIAGQPVLLKYHLSDATTGRDVGDLEPYLGAWGHTLILSEDQIDYVHSHPTEIVPDSADSGKLRGGPDLTFNAFLPRPGVYRIWTQLQRAGAVITVSFTVEAHELK